jgi:hypothetical protein
VFFKTVQVTIQIFNFKNKCCGDLTDNHFSSEERKKVDVNKGLTRQPFFDSRKLVLTIFSLYFLLRPKKFDLRHFSRMNNKTQVRHRVFNFVVKSNNKAISFLSVCLSVCSLSLFGMDHPDLFSRKKYSSSLELIWKWGLFLCVGV